MWGNIGLRGHVGTYYSKNVENRIEQKMQHEMETCGCQAYCQVQGEMWAGLICGWVLRLGFRIQGVGFRIQGVGFRIQGLRFRIVDVGFRVHAGKILHCS